MKNLINFFFSFDKLMKEKLILPFFWLVVIAWGLDFFATALSTISLGPLAAIVSFVKFFVTILLALVFIRLMCELAVAVFRINDNLSPDGGKSETANIDPMAEARKVAETAAERAREAAKIAGEKTQAATKSARQSMGGKSSDKASSPAEASTASSVAKAPPSRKTAPKNPVAKSKRVKASTTSSEKPSAKAAVSKSAAKKPTAKKATASKPAASKTASRKTASTSGRRGPKSGVKMRRDAQGRLLKKDGTLRAKPGPKS